MSPGATAATQFDRLSIQTTHILLPAGFVSVVTSIRLAPGIDRTLLRTVDEVRDAMLSKQTVSPIVAGQLLYMNEPWSSGRRRS